MAQPLASGAQEDSDLILPSSQNDQNCSRLLCRSPHPYRRHGTSILSGLNEEASGVQLRNQSDDQLGSISSSESGTEAGDERGLFLKALPAPRLKVHKGLRDQPLKDVTQQPTPLGSPTWTEYNAAPSSDSCGKTGPLSVRGGSQYQNVRDKYRMRRNLELAHRITETALFFATCLIVTSRLLSEGSLLKLLSPAIFSHLGLVTFLCLLYPLRRSYRAIRAGSSLHTSVWRGFHIPSRFDPAPLLYPIFLPMLVSASLFSTPRDFFLSNVVLSLSSLPSEMVLLSDFRSSLNAFHWLLTLSPLCFMNCSVVGHFELWSLLYPLHVFTVSTIEFLTTTSLDPAERHLLATALIDLYIFGKSPQSQILKDVLWHGTLLVFILCRWPLQAELSLARIPPWRFREKRFRPLLKPTLLQKQDEQICSKLARVFTSRKAGHEHESEDDENFHSVLTENAPRKLLVTAEGLVKHPTTNSLEQSPISVIEQRSGSIGPSVRDRDSPTKRRHTLPGITSSRAESHRTTPSGRPKRSLTARQHSFLALTPAQVAVRKWGYAAFTYAGLLLIILGPISNRIRRLSLGGYEPFGWALGYLFGNVPQFRVWVRSRELELWIPIPDQLHHIDLDQVGWVERRRQNTLGAANMRILLCSYCLAVLVVGMAIVRKLSSITEVDTRRKVFHGMMVAILLPTVFIDPCFISLALIIVLVVFLLLDLFRACQVPPISRPLASFLAPYVDGRDYRGPVIVSHIFLLFGCATPLWLSLAGVPRKGEQYWTGWEVDTRSVSMISGVVCVGMGTRRHH